MAIPTPGFVTYIISELSGIFPVNACRFFGGWQLRSDNKQFAIVMGGTLFFRVDDALRDEMQKLGCRPFSYAKQGTQVLVPKYMSAPDGVLDELDLLRTWAARVIAGT